LEKDLTMTEEKMALVKLIEQASDGDLIREMLAFAAERMMEMEVEAKTGAPMGARTASRTAQRNGYRPRAWDTRAGLIELAIPKLRKGSYFPSFLEPRRTAEKALLAGSRKPTSRGSPRGQLMTLCGPWGRAGSRRAKSAALSRISTSG
jgi:putative transposase